MRLLARKAIMKMLAFLSVKIHTHALGHSFRLSWGNDWGGLNLIRKGMCLHIKAIARGGSYLWGRESEYNFGITVQLYSVFSSQLEVTRTSFPLKRRKRRRLFTSTIPPILQSIPHLISVTFFNSFLLFGRYTVKARGMENVCGITYGEACNRVCAKNFLDFPLIHFHCRVLKSQP